MRASADTAGPRPEVAPPRRVRRRDALGPLLLAPLLGIAGPLVLWPALVVHLALPLAVARHVAGAGRARFAAEDAPRVAEGLEWLLSVYAWAALATTAPPWAAGARPVRLRLPPAPPPPGPGRAALRLVTGVPALLLRIAADVAGLVPWLAAVACVLVLRRLPAPLWRLQERALCGHARLLCRQAALVGAQSPQKASTAYWSRVWNHDSATSPSRMRRTWARLFSRGGRPSGREAV